MKPITKLYIKTFLFTGIPFGLIMLGFDLIDGDGFKLWKYLFMTFFFGITMSLILVSFHRFRLKKNGIQEITNENAGVNQTRNLKTELNKSDLIEKLKKDPVIGKMKITEIDNGILLKTGTTWKSWGEEIKISLKSANKNDFEYTVSSSPKLKTTLFDYGKNLENVTRVENVIKNIT
ncbi:hypothetical protein [Aquimarina sp. 2201CG5-10]|uniref:hypothetical protein n=1 Tax=Aquimarina callyspongiae TaxID=3098150 RepID=UPI002AB3B0D0|nr:hypothetical protein [Aquimarina sp. 2201CG5-10]MDY8137493.1 hypothetical protein [Aquimarina sp. 2201CG5-10]